MSRLGLAYAPLANDLVAAGVADRSTVDRAVQGILERRDREWEEALRDVFGDEVPRHPTRGEVERLALLADVFHTCPACGHQDEG